MIGVDWGTSSFRAFRLRGHAAIDRHLSPKGILNVPPGGFPDALRAAIAPWLADGERHVLMSGMIGSRQGWQEAPYLPCPAGAADLARALVPVPFDGAQVLLVPGLTVDGTVPEVMRGEEVQIVGALEATGPDAVACLPGSHSKWVRIANGQVAGFTTHLTGEAFAALRDHTILGRLMQPGAAPDPDAFARGVARSGDSGGLLHHLFGVRTLGLTGGLADAAAASYLSGLLIGHEVRAAAPAGTVHLIGDDALCNLYAQAIALCSGTSQPGPPDAAARGLALIGAHAPWT